ncbi:MAG: hypothetical protein GF329_04975 [Candidatus Lokiarchaeota archaeon]|nr:hypothetical protein [Candidatus Lokiarchaeota archaeon]
MKEQFLNFLRDFFSKSELNRLPDCFASIRIFSDPIVGVAKGNDKIFQKFKEVVGPNHLTPLEIWRVNGLPNSDTSAKNLRIISIVFPFTNEIRERSINKIKYPSKIYCVARNYANEFKKETLRQGIQYLQDLGFNATSGMLSDAFNIIVKGGFTSTWSERHVAFAAGLGTFSLHEGLITEVGCNIRLASIITDAPLKITPRESDDPYANCLYYSKGICKKCIERCPAGAITEEGHDKVKCWIYGQKVARKMIKELKEIIELKPHQRRINGILQKQKPPVGCAFCQFGVPCMDKNPTKNRNPD